MSSEEMRNELEAFVNTGLREGWGGWPLKEESQINQPSGVLNAGSIRFWRRPSHRVVAPGERLQAFKGGCRYCVEN